MLLMPAILKNVSYECFTVGNTFKWKTLNLNYIYSLNIYLLSVYNVQCMIMY